MLGIGPCLALYSPGESTSRVRLGVLYTVRNMYSSLTEYYSCVVLVLHAFRCRVAQAG
jgi:hypothetical protein